MLIEIFYPRVCGFCGRKIDSGNICARCKSSIAYKGFIHVPFNQTMHFDELYCNYDYDGLDEDDVQTEYEKKFRAQGISIKKVVVGK